jgi:hypothetical protein
MPTFHTGTVSELLAERSGLQRVHVDLGNGPERAYVLTQLTGPVAVGDRVVVNTTAVELGLGTGGWHVVHWNLERDEYVAPGGGHIMKLRYTSLQADTGAAEEFEEDLPHALHDLPVVVCGLHSQMAVASVVLKHLRPEARLVYVMTDGAALPLALSDLVADLKKVGVIDATITAGSAFGGDVEAVTVPAALVLAASRLDADAVIVSMGPGITGTGTRLGTTGIEVASIVDQVAALGGRPLVALRVSESDLRERHQGVSHHSRTVLDLCRTPAIVAAAEPVDLPSPHTVVVASPPPVGPLLEKLGVTVTTMGRGPDEDPAFFAAAGAAGAVVAGWLRAIP